MVEYKAPILVQIWGFCVLDILMKPALCLGFRFWQEICNRSFCFFLDLQDIFLKNSNFYTILLCTILFCLGCSKPVIEGEVKDCLDKPIENVRVSIKNTRLQTITDKKGKYSIEYIPGTFTVLYSKTDYTRHEMRLSLTSKEKIYSLQNSCPL